MPHPVVHFEITGRDEQAVTDFYQGLFGWSPRDAGPGYRLVEPQDGGIGGGLMRSDGEMPPHVTVYVAVEDLRATLDRAVELGGEIAAAPTPVPGVGSIGLFRDPDGNMIGLLQPE